MNKKLIIGIDVDAHLRKALSRAVKPFSHLPLRLHAPESYHVPIVNLGWVSEDATLDIIQALHAVSSSTSASQVEFTRITPSYKKKPQKGEFPDIRQANTLRCEGVPSESLKQIYTSLLQELDIPHAQVKKFAPYIVLGQMRKLQWEVLTHEDFPELDIEFPFTLDVSYLTLFEQATENGKRVFLPLEVFELG